MSNNLLATYSPESVIVVISNSNFSHTVSGYAAGTFLSITRSVPHATLYTGADATNARVVRRVRNYDITLTLAQFSESNDILTQLERRDEESRNGDDVFAITIKDTSGRSLYSANYAFIGTDPDSSFGVEMGEYAWLIHAVGMESFIGGNAKFTEAGYDAIVDLGHTPESYWEPSN